LYRTGPGGQVSVSATDGLDWAAVERYTPHRPAVCSGKLYEAWQALANLADMAGKIELTIRAESEEGFDRSKLHNGVIEPLREADLIE